jgi:hypothetical protein
MAIADEISSWWVVMAHGGTWRLELLVPGRLQSRSLLPFDRKKTKQKGGAKN